jgi:hypothetical protein
MIGIQVLVLGGSRDNDGMLRIMGFTLNSSVMGMFKLTAYLTIISSNHFY